MSLTLAPFTNESLMAKLWTPDFDEKVAAIPNIPSNVLASLKDPTSVHIYQLQIQQHQDGIIALFESVLSVLPETSVTPHIATIQGLVKSHMATFVDKLVKQVQKNLLFYLQNQHGEKIESKATSLTSETLDGFIANNDIVVLDFWAAWCAPCKILDPVINKVVDTYGNRIGVGKIDIDAQQALAQKYNVASVPTLLLFKKGTQQKRLTGFQQLDTIKKEIDALLDA